MEHPDPRSDDEQTIRILVNVQGQVFRARPQAKMHQAVIALVPRPPRAALNPRVPLESRLDANRVLFVKMRVNAAYR